MALARRASFAVRAAPADAVSTRRVRFTPVLGFDGSSACSAWSAAGHSWHAL